MLSDKTRVSLGLAVLVIGGGAWWLSALFWQVSASARSINEMSEAQTKYVKDFYELKTEIQVMHGELRELKKENE